MAFPTPKLFPFLQDVHTQIFVVAFALSVVIVFILVVNLTSAPKDNEDPGIVRSLLQFCYGCFLKPHEDDGTGSQQGALESFYKAQAGIYDATRSTLLRGREDMLGLVAAQLLYDNPNVSGERRVWVDIGGGTGYNIEAMAAHVPVPDFFSSVYLVDFSPSLCEVARKRFARLGWKNVRVICQDARLFKLEDYEDVPAHAVTRRSSHGYFNVEKVVGGADLLTMSYSLSMIPDFYSVVDSLPDLLAENGVIGVVDFYVQSGVDLNFRNYTGGSLSRHVNWFGRMFWRAWFDVDRVGLEAARRDYLEYKFGTVLSADCRNYLLGAIPYYIWLGREKVPTTAISNSIERIDAQVTESPYLHPLTHTNARSEEVEKSIPEIRSKAFDAAIINLSANLPLPSFFYQNHHHRIHYDDHLQKHKQFNNEYIYAFTWEDSRVDDRLLKLDSSDVVLAITSAGDNILSYALSSPARIHAVDLNPAQNNLLELKVASLMSLPYSDHWKIFGEGKHQDFEHLLITKLSPHLSSRAFQYWLDNATIFTSKSGLGLYNTGGSRHALRVVRVITTLLGLRSELKALLMAKTLNEQREIYQRRLRPVFLSKILSYLMISSEKFLWAALGVPHNQVVMLENDHAITSGIHNRGAAVFEYLCQTIDPVMENALIGADNPYYQVSLAGHYTPRCHPAYLSPKAHSKLSKSKAFDGLRIHTDEIEEVVNRLTPGTLTVAVVMDSMDWFDPGSTAATTQIEKLNRALKKGGRVLLRSAGLTPWYVSTFENLGFDAKRVGKRDGGNCVDRVNMYASVWIFTKVRDWDLLLSGTGGERAGSIELELLEI